MAVPSDGSYGIPAGLVFSFPVTIDGATKEWKIVQGLSMDDFAKGKIAATQKVRSLNFNMIELASLTVLQELEEERDDALKACDEANM